MDYYTILAQRTLLSRNFVDKRIESVKIKDKYNIFLGFEGNQALKLSSVPDMPYIVTLEKRYIPQKNARVWYQKHFSGRKLTELQITHGDRILSFHFDSGIRLIFEMTGRHSNIIAVDHVGTITGAVRKVTKRESGVREIKQGTLYKPPPSRDFTDLAWVPLPVIEKQLKSMEDTILGSLSRTLCSGSRFFALEALSLAGIDPEIYSIDLSSDTIFRLFKIMAELISKIEQGGNGATIIYSKDSLPRDVFPIKMTASNLSIEHMDNLDEAVRRYAREREIELEKRSLRNNIIGSLNREEQSIKSTILKIERECGDKSEPENLERIGNTILANLHLLKKGMKTAMLADPYGSGEIEVNLNQTLDGPANARRFFKRAKKIRSASKIGEERLSNLRNRLENIIAERDSVANIDEIKMLKTIAVKHKKIQTSATVFDADEKFPRRFRSVSGLEIIVGRNDRENDELIRWAHKNDFWLHAQNIGGSHVILRSTGRQSPDQKSVELAAAIAAYYSKAKTSAVVPVACTQVKYVVKRKGQGPGKVTYTREKVMFVQPGVPGRNG